MEKLFHPEKVAVIGVSPSPENLGRNIVWNLIRFGFQGEVICYGRRPGHIYGHRIHNELQHLPPDIDVAVILLPAPRVIEVVEVLSRRGTQRFIIETGGFSEHGEEGERMEKALRELAHKRKLKIVGPNCIGVTDRASGLVTSFMPLDPSKIHPGPVAVIAQSGGVGLSYVNLLCEEGLGISKFVSMGNKLILNEADFLHHLEKDPNTQMVLLYLEGISNGRAFYQALKGISKPVVVHKANVTEASAQIARFHTAAMATREEILTGAIVQAGKIRVVNNNQALAAVKALHLPPLKGNNLAIVSRSGGEAVLAADAAGNMGFQLPPYPQPFLDFVQSLFRAGVIRPTNPLDLGDLFDIVKYTEIIEEIVREEIFHGVVFLIQLFDREWELVEYIMKRTREICQTYQKPISLFLGGDLQKVMGAKALGIYPVFNSPHEAVEAMGFLLTPPRLPKTPWN